MNILLINHYAGSPYYGMEYRPFYMAREWVRMGHHITIVGATFSHLRSKQPVTNEECQDEFIEGIRYVWLAAPSYQGNGIGRVANMATFIYRLFKLREKVVGWVRPDLVIASSTYPLDIYPARYIAKKYDAKLVYEVHDLWPLSPMELGGMSKYHPFIMVMQAAENYAYEVVDKVVSMLPKAEQHMIEHGLEKGKFVYVPNGIDLKEWRDEEENIPKEHLETLNSLCDDKKFIIGYAGGHALSNALQFFINVAEIISDKDIAFVLVGKGAEKEKLIKVAEKKGLRNVFFLPPVSKKSISALLCYFDVSYIGWNKEALYRFGVCPNKLFDYMMSGKPIIHSVSAGNDLVAEAGCGISVPAEDERAIADAIVKMKSYSNEERLLMGQCGQKFVAENHDYRVLAKKFLDHV